MRTATNKAQSPRLTEPQRNILSILVERTVISRGPRKGALKDVLSSDSFDGRSFGALVRLGLVEYHSGVVGSGFVATPAGAALILR